MRPTRGHWGRRDRAEPGLRPRNPNLMPAPKRPQSHHEKPPVNVELLERTACAAVSLPHHSDIESGKVEDLHLNLGTFKVLENPAAVDAVIQTYRSTVSDEFYTRKKFERLVHKAEINALRKQREIDEWSLTRERLNSITTCSGSFFGSNNSLKLATEPKKIGPRKS